MHTNECVYATIMGENATYAGNKPDTQYLNNRIV